MKITRRQLQYIIKEAVEQQQSAELEKKYDLFFDKVEVSGGGFLENLADSMKAAAKKEGDLDEAGMFMLGAGLAAAMPVLLKGIEVLVLKISKGLKKIDGMVIGSGKLSDAGEKLDDWANWWKTKSEDLHHAYIGGIEKIVDAVCFITGKNPSKEKRHKAATAIWTVIVAYLMVQSGVGVLKAVGHHAYGLAGLEGVLATIKAGEVGVYLSEVFEVLLTAKVATAL